MEGSGFGAGVRPLWVQVQQPAAEPRRVSVDAIEHWMIYRQNPGVGAILHVHAWMDGIAATEINFPCGSEELAESVAALVAAAPDPVHAVVGLRNHGITATGESLRPSGSCSSAPPTAPTWSSSTRASCSAPATCTACRRGRCRRTSPALYDRGRARVRRRARRRPRPDRGGAATDAPASGSSSPPRRGTSRGPRSSRWLLGAGRRRRTENVSRPVARNAARLAPWLVSPDDVRAASHWWFVTPAKAVRELGFTTRPTAETVADTIADHARTRV
jgi:hypothetical protein